MSRRGGVDAGRQAGRQAGTAPTFDDVVSIVERAAGVPLTGPARELARSAWLDYPHGVAMCASAAAMRGRAPTGLFVRMLRDGDHVRNEAALADGAPAPSRPAESAALDEADELADGSGDVPAGLAQLGRVLGVEPPRLRSIEDAASEDGDA
jgi:hypothetical protein